MCWIDLTAFESREALDSECPMNLMSSNGLMQRRAANGFTLHQTNQIKKLPESLKFMMIFSMKFTMIPEVHAMAEIDFATAIEGG